MLKALLVARLVTLTGPGGVGKTRLAAEASKRLGAAAWFVPLAPVTDPAEVAYAVLDTLRQVSVNVFRSPSSGVSLRAGAGSVIGAWIAVIVCCPPVRGGRSPRPPLGDQ